MAAPGGRRALCDESEERQHRLVPPAGVGEQTVLAIALQSFPIPIMHFCRQLLLCPSQKPSESSKAAAVLVSSPITSENAFQFSRLSSSTQCWLRLSSEGGGCCKTCGLGCFSVSVSLKQIHIHHIGSFQPYRPTGCQNET